jgi:hypothetical protein
MVSPFRTLSVAFEKTRLVTEAEIPTAARPVDLYFGDEALRLAGYQLETEPLHPGEWLKVTLFWRATRPISRNYSTFVHILTPDGKSIAQANSYPDGGRWPTSIIPVGKILPATYHILIPPEITAPVATRLAIGIYEYDDPERAAKDVVSANGEPLEAIFEGVPIIPREWPTRNPVQQEAALFGQQIRLIGVDPIDQPVGPGTSFPLTFYWETIAAPGQDLNLFIHLLNPDTGQQLAGFDGPPSFPTRYWQPGTKIIDPRTLDLPADLPPGDYSLYIGWYNLESYSRLPLDAVENHGDAYLLMTIEIE